MDFVPSSCPYPRTCANHVYEAALSDGREDVIGEVKAKLRYPSSEANFLAYFKPLAESTI